MTDDEIKGLFYSYGQYVSGKDYALIRALEKVIAPQRTWVGLTDEVKQEWIDAMPNPPQPRHFMVLVNAIESELKKKNT